MKKTRQVKSNAKGCMFIVSPTLDMMLASCRNVKQLAYDCGVDYSNFVKTCKFQRDIRISTYQRCAGAFGMDTLILHLPSGVIESIVSVQSHIGNQCLMIQKEDMLQILRHFYPMEMDDALSYVERFIDSLLKGTERELLKKLLPHIADIFQTLAESYGDK